MLSLHKYTSASAGPLDTILPNRLTRSGHGKRESCVSEWLPDVVIVACLTQIPTFAVRTQKFSKLQTIPKTISAPKGLDLPLASRPGYVVASDLYHRLGGRLRVKMKSVV